MAERSLSNQLQEALALLSILLHPSKTRAEKVYQFLSTHNNLAETSLYLNLGYWHTATTYDQACQSLAQLLGERAQLKPADIVLDVGFGFADQDLFWAQHFRLQKIIGLNITPLQIEVGKRRVDEAGLSDRIDLRFGSATDIPLEKETVDKVVCLESAFHFNTRETFFQEAWRVLRPGGWLAIAEMIPLQKPPNLRTSINEAVGQLLWQIPDANMYTAEVLDDKLRSCGFENRKLESIREKVFIPFGKFARRRIQDPEVKKRMNPLLRWLWSVDHDKEITDDGRMDYLIITAQKL
jgi:ubiquinone/menaquinone biosynthesis C-methylase UbiE